jgi:serine/threonine protein kinase
MNPLSGTPKAIGPFEVLEMVGQGGCATVYKACYKPTGKLVAVKVGHGLMELEPAVLERFKREFTVIRRLRHPNLVRALGLGKENGTPFIVMEYVPGQNLERLLRSKGPCSLEETITIFLQVAEGLRYLHSKNLLHRDIKPSNILLDDQNHAKLTDFGLLKDLTDEAPLTLSRQGMGTMEYGAPEQFENAKHVDRRCDLYSLAATLYTALTGKFPFGNGGHLQIMERKLLNQFVPLRLLLPWLAPAIDRLVNCCLESNPNQRPSDCDEFVGVLRNTDTCPVSSTAVTEIDLPRMQPAIGAERRATLRFAIDLTATFVPFHQKMRGRWQGTILDVSREGIRLQTPRPVAVNSVLQVTLGKRLTSELALVRWVKPSEGESQIVGCSFVRPLPSQVFEEICQSGACTKAVG